MASKESKNRTIKLISWNVNGIRAAIKKGFLDFVEEHDPDILCIQETKAQKGQAEIDLPQYEEYWNSAEKKGYSGTLIFTKEKPHSVRFDLDGNEKLDAVVNGNSEGRVITAEYDDFFLVNVYTPNSKRALERLDERQVWDEEFAKYLKALEKQKPVVVCGDLNVAHKEIDLARPKDNTKNAGFTPEEKKGFQRLIDKGFVDTFRMFNQEPDNYTWWSYFAKSRERNIGWRIDYFLVSESIRTRVKDAFILPDVMGSDHCPVGIELEILS
jgi:exodeoxyribonuclease-3